jgi:hypothetical protein
MPSNSLRLWRTARCRELDEVASARGGRVAAQQINYGYALLLSANFQGFCRDLHTEAADILTRRLTTPSFQAVVFNVFTSNRRLDAGNPNPGNLGSDFDRLGMTFWPEVNALNPRNAARQRRLEELNAWRNAIAHHDFTRVGGRVLRVAQVRRWRAACDRLASAFDRVLFLHIRRESGSAPW